MINMSVVNKIMAISYLPAYEAELERVRKTKTWGHPALQELQTTIKKLEIENLERMVAMCKKIIEGTDENN